MPERLYLQDVAGCWKEEVADANGIVKLFSPFITQEAVDHVFGAEGPLRCEVYTLFRADHFAKGASSLDTLKSLQERGARLFDLAKLHAKILLVPGKFASVGSQNFTGNGRRNKEATITFTSPM